MNRLDFPPVTFVPFTVRSTTLLLLNSRVSADCSPLFIYVILIENSDRTVAK